MNKLAIAAFAVAGFCGAVSADVTSANVVGYNLTTAAKSTDFGVMFGSSFKNCSGENIKLKDLQGNFNEGDQIQVSFIDGDGLIQFNIYQYYSYDPTFETEDPGWYSDEPASAANIEIKQGEAAWFIAAENSAMGANGITIAGQVTKEQYVKDDFTQSFTMLCNPFPTAFNPGDSKVHWEGLQDGDEIQVAYIDNSGLIQFNIYQYYSYDPTFETEDAGWFTDEPARVTEPIAAAGQGFWFHPADPASVVLKIDSPIAD